MRTCTTHHHACDCREAKHAAEVEYLSAEIGRLRTEVGRLREAVRVNALVWRRCYDERGYRPRVVSRTCRET
jgi:hypothetical protein